MNITKAYCINHATYKSPTTMTVKGLVLHSIGCAQPDCQKVRDNWNNNPNGAIAHYTLDDSKILQCLPSQYMAWHIGSPGNSFLIGCEMGEPSEVSYAGVSGYEAIVSKIKTYSDSAKASAIAYCKACYNNAVELFASLCQEYNLDPLTQIYTHYYLSTNNLYNCNSHVDPQHLWDGLGLGYTIDTFRKAVAQKMGVATTSTDDSAKISDVAEILLDIARDEIGYHEKASNANLDDKTANSGSNNFTKYADELHDAGYYANSNKNGYAWCAVFTDWLFYKLNGCDATVAQAMQYQSGTLGASCTESANYYKKAGKFSTTPMVGAEIFFGSTSSMEHTGIVESFNASTVTTIEGNTSDQVLRRTYSRNNSRIQGYGIPNYGEYTGSVTTKSTSSSTKTTTTNTASATKQTVRYGDANASVKLMQERLIELGYSCGSCGADGEFGDDTYNALVAFQKDAFPNDSDEWDGVCGAKTWAQLYATTSVTTEYTPKVGDVVNFTGNVHYISAYTNKGKECKPGTAKITMIATGNVKHPYHLIKTNGSSSTVHGFVDAGTFTKQ